MKEWQQRKFGELYKVPSRNGVSKPSRVRGSGYKMINMGELFANDRIYDIDMELVPLTDTEKEKAKVESGDLLFARQSLVASGAGKCSIVMKTSELTVFESHLIRVRLDQEIADPMFYYYYFKSPRSPMRTIIEHCVQAGIKASDLEKLLVKVPPIEEQRKTARVLSRIDKKIEVNKEINENLEQQALMLFRHYFMDFEPYGCSAPSSWSKVSLDDVCTRITDGSHYSPSNVPDAPYPMYSVKNMETYGFDSTSCKHITAEDFHKMQKNDCVPRLNDILVAKDGSYLKEIFICSEEKDEAILSSIAIFRPNTEVIIPEILLYLLKQPAVRKDVGDNYVSGSALPRIVLKDFKKYTFLLPPMTEQLKIGAVLHTIRMKTKANIDEIQNLSTLRDTLLPQLMSGELDVSEIKF